MKILIGKTFGIGNAICAMPMIKAIYLANPKSVIHIVVGEGPDDFGAMEVFEPLKAYPNISVFTESTLKRLGGSYNTAVMAIPFDGRWRNGIDYHADTVLDGRTRPDPSTTGFISWKKHEVEYQMENAYLLGFKREYEIPDCKFLRGYWEYNPKRVFVGMGYKKDAAGFWKVKHWGNENFAALIKMILDSDPDVEVYSAGNMADLSTTMGPVARIVDNSRFKISMPNLQSSMELVVQCGIYLGNDTGMMHVAASENRRCAAVFKMENASTKSHPWCDHYEVLDGVSKEVTPEEMFAAYRRLKYAAKKEHSGS